MGPIRELPRDRRRRAEAIERSPDETPLPLAESVLALQHTAGNAAVQRMLAVSRPAANVLARAPHRPPQGGRIRYQNVEWQVVLSDEDNPMITIRQTAGQRRQRQISWADEDFWIIRENVGGDFDLREEGQEDDAEVVRTRFDEAKTKALKMLKDYARPHVQQTSVRALNELTLDDDFQVTQTNRNTDGDDEACEWKLTWKEGSNPDRPRRIWYFTVDVDDPPPTSHQEPHVGWEARGEPGGFGRVDAVERQLGHIWLNKVPVGRGAMAH
jgi:hypothetical protein